MSTHGEGFPLFMITVKAKTSVVHIDTMFVERGVNLAPGPPWPIKSYWQTLKLAYIMHEVIAIIYEPNSIDDKPQYHKTPCNNIFQ